MTNQSRLARLQKASHDFRLSAYPDVIEALEADPDDEIGRVRSATGSLSTLPRV